MQNKSDTPSEGLDPKIAEIMEARQKRAEALHERIFEAREKIRSHLHPESPSWQREAFDLLHAAHHILGGDPFDMHMRAALSVIASDTAGLPSDCAGLVEQARKAIDAGEEMIATLTSERNEARAAGALLAKRLETALNNASRYNESVHKAERKAAEAIAALSRAPEADRRDAEIAALQETVRKYGNRAAMSFAPSRLQEAIDRAMVAQGEAPQPIGGDTCLDGRAEEPDWTLVDAELDRMTVEFVARMAWRTDPPNAVNKLTESERLSAIKWHPRIKKAGDPHQELADHEAARPKSGGDQ